MEAECGSDRDILVLRMGTRCRVVPGVLPVRPGQSIRFFALLSDVRLFFPEPEIFESHTTSVSLKKGTSYEERIAVSAPLGDHPYAAVCVEDGTVRFAQGHSEPRIVIY